MTCEGCSISYTSLLTEMGADEFKYLDFLRSHGVITEYLQCPRCTSRCREAIGDFKYRCDRSYIDAEQRRIRCSFCTSMKNGTWLEKSKLSFSQICQFVCLWLTTMPPQHAHIMRELGVSTGTVVDWSNYCREICINSLILSGDDVIGGPGVVVDVDKAKFGKRKYNGGRTLDGTWIVGGFERGTGRCFFEPIQDHSAHTLREIILRRIVQGSTIITDLWRGDDCLPHLLLCQHFIVKNSENFVDPVTGAHIQNIERTWQSVRANIPRTGRTEEHMAGYLAEYCWKKKYCEKDRAHFFWLEVARQFNPNG